MYVSPVLPKVYNYQIKKQQNKTSTNNAGQNNITRFDAPNYYINFGEKPISKLFEEYNWYINHDKTPAIKSFLKIDESKEVMNNFLTTILNTEDRSYQLIDSIVSNPREMDSILKALEGKVGGGSKNLLTFLPTSPYSAAYQKYTEKKLQNAHTLYEILRIRPDWKGEVLIKKFQQLKGNEPLTIGKIPKEFPNNHFSIITNYLRGQVETGLKLAKKIDSLTLDNRKYDFEFFTDGRSDKNVFGVYTPEGKKYVIKMAAPESRSLDAPFALGTLAKIDTYLTGNRSRNSAPLCYYNHDENLSVYKFINQKTVKGNDRDLRTIMDHLPDFRALSLNFNDTIGSRNFFMLDKEANEDFANFAQNFEDGINKEWISVDNDHVTFSNRLHPLVSEYHKDLPVAIHL